LTSTGTYAASPRWSPDGRRIAFDSNQEGGWDIFVIDADGGGSRHLVSGAGENLRPTWSVDGKWVYFGSTRSGDVQVWKVPVDGGEPVQVTYRGGYEAVESADGRSVYYTRRGIAGLWKTTEDGGDETLVLKELQWNYSKNWTVTSKGIYYLACSEDASVTSPCSAYFFDFETKASEEIAPLGRVVDSGISLSSDGQWLLCVQSGESETDVILVDGFR
jgi:Tol biopolymer transport system component